MICKISMSARLTVEDDLLEFVGGCLHPDKGAWVVETIRQVFVGALVDAACSWDHCGQSTKRKVIALAKLTVGEEINTT